MFAYNRIRLRVLAGAVLVVVGAALLLALRPELEALAPGMFKAPVHDIQLKDATPGHITVNVTAETAYWEARIQAVGDTAAHAEFLASAEKLSHSPLLASEGTQPEHTATHTFGEALYKVEGLKGINACGPEYGQGCLHGFFGLAVQDYGVEAGVAQLSALCAAEKDEYSRISCEHGLGHGILSYLGYSFTDLLDALSVCGRAEPASDFAQGCGGGAFMEYNIRFLLLSDSTSTSPVRQFSTDTMYEPCAQLSSDTYREACMFWQPLWWFSSPAVAVTPSVAAHIATYCDAVPFASASTTLACFEGIGYVLPQKISSPENVARSCAAVSDNITYRIACWSYAEENLPVAARVTNSSFVCSGLSGTLESACLTEAAQAPAATDTVSPEDF